MTIENLSLRSGVTTRNIRAYQSRGLLPPPVSRPGTRAAFYTPEHLAKLRLVSRLQDRGFSLAGIADLLAALATGKSIEQVLGVESALIASEEDQSRLVSESELRALLPTALDRDEAIKRLIAVRLVVATNGSIASATSACFSSAWATNAGIPSTRCSTFVRLRFRSTRSRCASSPSSPGTC
jgi:DNA-binding transcriptional MerR regulator